MQLGPLTGIEPVILVQCSNSSMDHSPINQNFELNKSRQKFHHSLKEHHKITISNVSRL
jgi:hypothetical protein